MRAGFYINLPIGGVAAVLLFLIPIAELTLKPPFSLALVRKVIPDLDLIGFTLFIPSSILLLLALQFGSGNTFAWGSSTVIGLFCGAGVSIILFIIWERRMGDRAMLPGTLLRQRIMWTSCLYGSCIMSCLVTASNWLPTYFQAVRGDGPTLSGVHILPSILSQLLVVIVVGATGKSIDCRYTVRFTDCLQYRAWDIISLGRCLVAWSLPSAMALSRPSRPPRASQPGSVFR
jgi:hypothetical protein